MNESAPGPGQQVPPNHRRHANQNDLKSSACEVSDHLGSQSAAGDEPILAKTVVPESTTPDSKPPAGSPNPSTRWGEMVGLHAILKSSDKSHADQQTEAWAHFLNRYSTYIDNKIAEAADEFFQDNPQALAATSQFCKTNIQSELYKIFTTTYNPWHGRPDHPRQDDDKVTGRLRLFIKNSVYNIFRDSYKFLNRGNHRVQQKAAEILSRSKGAPQAIDEMVASEELYQRLEFIIDDEIKSHLSKIENPTERKIWESILQATSVGNLKLLQAYGLVDNAKDPVATRTPGQTDTTKPEPARDTVYGVREGLLKKIQKRILLELRDELQDTPFFRNSN